PVPEISMSNLEHALAYARLGWPVFPVKITKRPYTTHGFKDASLDEEQIKAWWKSWPFAGIGCSTGQVSGFWVLDIDPRHGGDLSLETLIQAYGVLPDTRESRTGGGGRHLYFRWPSDRAPRNKQSIEPGIDTRGDGGYVVLPPSRHHKGGAYAWQIDDQI